jgi:hypothetical protein
MVSTTLAIIAASAGYLLGGRADRERFDRIKEQAIGMWIDPAGQGAATPDPPV